MGQPQSVQIQSEINRNDGAVAGAGAGISSLGGKNLNGQKTQSIENNNNKVFTLKTISDISSSGHDFVDDDDSTTVDSFVDETEEEEEEEDEEIEEFLLERKMILQEAKKLRVLAEFYSSPEKPVMMDGTASARCFFNRYSATEEMSADDEEERESALSDAAALKKVAMDYLHPERPVQVTDPTACGRSYFDRYSAPVQDEDVDQAEYKQVMEEMKRLKTVATWYLHPEMPVECDGFAMGRNYYSRPSAEPFEEDDEDIERDLLMKDLSQLKQTAEWYLKPELPLVVDATCFGRDYFSRSSATEYDDEEIREEQERIMQDLRQLKTTAEWYLKPEVPVITTDPTACGRNFFARASAPEYDDDGVAEERATVLAEMSQLKQVADWYLHPERPVASSDPTARARNYFDRASAPDVEDEDDMEERELILAEMAELKKVAGWYMHPERPVVCEDPCAYGRNYFGRASAPIDEEEDERQQVLAEAAELKKVARWYMHPEKPVVTEGPCTNARNYFTRPSAAEYEEEDEMDERERVLSEALEMKKYADWFLHPENPVQSDAFVRGRNYFSRPSAPEQEDEELSEERQLVLSESKKLKEVAEWYHCPEKPVHTDGFAPGRNYFNRPSAQVQDTDDVERDSILADAKALKQVAEWYHCPEKAVEVESTACARNFFSRPSAPEYEDAETNEERDAIFADATKLKEVAEWYHHPEAPVDSAVAVTRNYFTRPSAEEHVESPEQEEERAAILAEALELKKLAVDYLHPEKPVVSNVNCVRNYFDRPSATGHADHIHTEGHSINEHGLLDHHIEHHDMHHNDYFHYHDYAYHHDDDHSHGTQSDHFEMDEDVFHNFRQSMVAHQEHQEQTVPIIKEEKEGNLSRSPSDVMLFDESVM